MPKQVEGSASYQYKGACPERSRRDGENRMVAFNTTAATYTYLGASRIKKVSGSTTTVYVFSGSKVLAEYVNAVLSKEYVYAGGGLLATIAGSAVTYHQADHLSTRLETDSAAAVSRTFAHYPFGELWYETGTASKWKFTSYERDSESGLDYAMFRYDSTRVGRFLSPDLVAGSLSDPQSLNRYAYVLNDPVNFADPFGLYICGDCPLPPEPPDEGGGGRGGVFHDRPRIPWLTEFEPRGGAGGGRAPLGRKDQKAFDKNREKLLDALARLANCLAFLAAHGITSEDLVGAIIGMVPYNGAKSSISRGEAGTVDLEYANAIGVSPSKLQGILSGPVSGDFTYPSNVSAEAGSNGAVFFRPGRSNVSPQVIFHESLHLATRKGDGRLAQQLGVPGDFKDLGSADVNKALADHDCPHK